MRKTHQTDRKTVKERTPGAKGKRLEKRGIASKKFWQRTPRGLPGKPPATDREERPGRAKKNGLWDEKAKN